ncbi:kinetochore protein spc7 [Trichoderma asperellum]|uniref:Kinetochore protein spc7 n=1 Tax=Trichoderma asperellum TaxID=101201 RepID=A0A6V8R208_TRIAP|nr:kinetochore protein spc7 [Trichoderma asperellum]
MSAPGEATLPATRRSRKSIGVHTELSRKENATIDSGGSLAASRKSRSKSIGPGGLDALRQGNGNRRASLAVPTKLPRSILKPSISPLPEIPPLKPQASRKSIGASAFSIPEDELSGSKVALKTEEEQQAAAKEREERERRDARRKSLANRRVSFAAEATLHTFHEVEYMQNRNAAESRRKSGSGFNPRNADAQFSAEDQNAKGRRSSLAAQNNVQSQDNTATSTIYSSDSEPADAVEEIATDEEEEIEDENSNSDSDDGTMMSLETEDVTGTTVASSRSIEDIEDESTLDEALRFAARLAATQQLGEDSDDGEEIIPSFGWVKKANHPPPASTSESKVTSKSPINRFSIGRDEDGTEMDMDMDITQAVGKIIKPTATEEADDEPEQDVSMDVTRAFGGVLSNNKENGAPSGSGEMDDGAMEEATMELTTAVGGIRYPQLPDIDTDDDDGNEDMSMELTSVMGGLLARHQKEDEVARRQTLKQTSKIDADDATMDMTVGFGNILSNAHNSVANNKEGQAEGDDETTGMDLTTAIGGIIKNTSRAFRKSFFGRKTDEPENSPQPMPTIESQAPAEQSTPVQKSSARLFESPGAELQAAHEVCDTQILKNTATSYIIWKDTDTHVTEPSSSIIIQKFYIAEGKPNTITCKINPKGRYEIDSEERCEINPKECYAINSKERCKINSTEQQLYPSATFWFWCRSNWSRITSTSVFVPGKRTVAFNETEDLAPANDESDEGSQSRLGRPEPQTDRDATLNLREMIDSMSPKRNPLRGRKSLHIGSARGLLGKRPIESDDEADAEENDGVKRLKGREGSPVENVKLQLPPSKEETTGRLRRSTRLSFDFAGRTSQSAFSSPIKGGKFLGAVKENQTVHDVQIHQPPMETVEEGQMHLQDFLDLTSIRFMELTTTKRRHTIAPRTSQSGILPDGEDDRSLERCVVAGACTVPMLELYQHSCRELKKYISEGRRIVKEIETETFEDNPPLFQEYMSATPDVKALMDNQFKNVRTHSRHLSKAMWYEWRMKLQEGLKEGLVSISGGMNDDVKIIEEQEALLKSVMPNLVGRYESLLEESNNLEEAARELADCDPAELQAAREELVSLDDDIAQKKKLIAKLRQEFEASEADVEELTARKARCLAEIQESEKIREECRGWTSTEVNILKARVEALEKEHGWAVTGISGPTLSMTYKREIELVVDITSFQPQQPSSRIDLWYIADSRECKLHGTSQIGFLKKLAASM